MTKKAFFIGDQAALDFLNTIAAPRGETIEFIPDGETFLTWQADAELLEKSELQAILGKFGKPALDQVASEARQLREWFRESLQQIVNSPTRELGADVITTLNRILMTDNNYLQLQVANETIQLRQIRKLVDVKQLLVPLALKMAELFIKFDRSLIKRCANPNCTLWFYDQTKAHRRQFCSAAVCGNRAKVAAYRKRQRQHD